MRNVLAVSLLLSIAFTIGLHASSANQLSRAQIEQLRGGDATCALPQTIDTCDDCTPILNGANSVNCDPSGGLYVCQASQPQCVNCVLGATADCPGNKYAYTGVGCTGPGVVIAQCSGQYMPNATAGFGMGTCPNLCILPVPNPTPVIPGD
jgi:hypothetical protein